MTNNTHDPVKISVVMSAYNAEPWIGKAMESTLMQTYRDFEFLIVNDGSTDGTGAIIDEYARRDERIRPIHHPNWGLCKSVNHAVSLAEHEWIARMDADDIMMPNRFERQLAFINEHPDAGVVSTLAELIDIHGNVHWRTSTDLLDREAFERYRGANKIMPIYQNSVMMRKSVFTAIGGHRSEYWPCDDMDLWNRIADDGTLILIQPEHLVQYRIHSSSVSVAQSHDQMVRINWVRHSTACRRNSVPELTFDEFLAHQHNQPRLARIRGKCNTLGEVLYKTGTTRYINGERIGALIPLTGSLLVSPVFWIGRMKSKFSRLARNRSFIKQS